MTKEVLFVSDSLDIRNIVRKHEEYVPATLFIVDSKLLVHIRMCDFDLILTSNGKEELDVFSAMKKLGYNRSCTKVQNTDVEHLMSFAKKDFFIPSRINKFIL